MPLFTAKSEFTEEVQPTDGFNCNGCYEPIYVGSKVFIKPYEKLGRLCHVRLHNLEACWEAFDDRVWQKKATQREKGIHPRRRKVYVTSNK